MLGDVEKRSAYDQLGKEWTPGQDFKPPPNWDANFEFSGAPPPGAEAGFSDFFETIFGGMRGDRPARGQRAEFHSRGEDHHAKIIIDVRDVFGGASRSISLRLPQIDEAGRVTVREHALNVQIPKGVIEGQHIRLKGQGGPGSGRLPAGDLYLEIRFKPVPIYRATGPDLTFDLPIAPWEAALGASVEVPTPVGPIMLKIPPGSSQGRELRIKGRGIPAEKPGDLYAVLKLVLPPADTPRAKEIYEEMARALPFNPRASLGV